MRLVLTMKSTISNHITSSIQCKQSILENYSKQIEQIASVLIDTFKKGNALYLCGNGGSASDAQHIAAELSGRYKIDRSPLPAESLNNNTSAITAIANDYGFEYVYERLLQSQSRAGDCVICISTSGKSKNIIKAAKYAKDNNITTIGFTGEQDSELSQICDISLKIPSSDTPIIQESHIMVGHILCHIIEEAMFQS